MVLLSACRILFLKNGFPAVSLRGGIKLFTLHLSLYLRGPRDAGRVYADVVGRGNCRGGGNDSSLGAKTPSLTVVSGSLSRNNKDSSFGLCEHTLLLSLSVIL